MRSLLIFLSLVSITMAGIAISKELRREQAVNNLSKNKLMRILRDAANDPANANAACFTCSLVVDTLQIMIKNNRTDNDIGAFLTDVCDGLNLEQNSVCYGVVKAFQDEAVFVLERTLFTPDEICGAFVDNCGNSIDPLQEMWNITIPGGKPPVKPWPQIKANQKTVKVLQLSDIHIDRQYLVGSEAYCQEDQFLNTYALCCRDYADTSPDRSDRMKPKKIFVPSGPWGMPYVCDIPYALFDNAMAHIAKAHKDLDYIIITGDFEAHDAWDYTKELTTVNVQNITAALLKHFPKTPIYVSIGNHEGVPQDAMAPHTMAEYDTRGPQWLYSLMKDMWSNWIPNTVLPDVQYRASYAVRPFSGLKLISINTVYCSEYNFYLYIDQIDPDATLQWLIDELQDSESKNEKVHIISHIPPGDSYCLKGWAWNFWKIVHRYENTITANLFGHTHQDHFQVYYDSANPNTRPFHTNWISPSLTTYAWNNPSYRIYTVDGGYDGATWTILDADTYSTDLMKANNEGKQPVWSLEYNHRREYGMQDLSPTSFDQLANNLWTNTTLFQTFIRHYYRNDYNNECYAETSCRRGFICHLVTARNRDSSFCDQYQ